MALTLQTNEVGRPVKAGQIMLIEYIFHLSVEVHYRITVLIFQLHLDVALELITFCENCYDRNLKIPSRDINTYLVHLM